VCYDQTLIPEKKFRPARTNSVFRHSAGHPVRNTHRAVRPAAKALGIVAEMKVFSRNLPGKRSRRA
jgi:hypothetical protein